MKTYEENKLRLFQLEVELSELLTKLSTQKADWVINHLGTPLATRVQTEQAIAKKREELSKLKLEIKLQKAASPAVNSPDLYWKELKAICEAEGKGEWVEAAKERVKMRFPILSQSVG